MRRRKEVSCFLVEGALVELKEVEEVVEWEYGVGVGVGAGIEVVV